MVHEWELDDVSDDSTMILEQVQESHEAIPAHINDTDNMHSNLLTITAMLMVTNEMKMALMEYSKMRTTKISVMAPRYSQDPYQNSISSILQRRAVCIFVM